MKKVFVFLFLVAAVSCIDRYYPNLKNYNSILVVEGLITNENSSYTVRLRLTTGDETAVPQKVTNASINIIDNDGSETHLKNIGDGSYKTDSTAFRGIIGKKYILQILTADGKEYRSDECKMLPVANIDSVYYSDGEEKEGINGALVPGLKIYLNTGDASGLNQYFRWTYDEDWKFLLPNPVRYTCLMVVDAETYLFKEVPVVKEICFKNSTSDGIITNAILSGNSINGQVINFIDPVKSDRLTQRYSINIKQYSISENEHDFWNNLKKVGQSGSDIFATQPYQVISNIHNVNDANEMVLGYFEVSSVASKRIFISAHDLYSFNLPRYEYACHEIAKSPDDWPDPRSQPSYYDIYYKIMTGYTFIRPIFNYNNTIQKLVFATKECSDCDVTGVSKKPDFWIDK